MALRLYVIFFSLLLVSSISYAQKRNQLEQKRRTLIEEINYTNKLLKKNKRKKSLTLNQLAIVNQKISLRQKLINQIGSAGARRHCPRCAAGERLWPV